MTAKVRKGCMGLLPMTDKQEPLQLSHLGTRDIPKPENLVDTTEGVKLHVFSFSWMSLVFTLQNLDEL